MGTVSLADAVGAACDLLGNEAQAGKLKIEREVARKLMVRADDTRLRQVLLNIGSNAIKYNRAGGWVGMKAWRLEPDRVWLEVYSEPDQGTRVVIELPVS